MSPPRQHHSIKGKTGSEHWTLYDTVDEEDCKAYQLSSWRGDVTTLHHLFFYRAPWSLLPPSQRFLKSGSWGSSVNSCISLGGSSCLNIWSEKSHHCIPGTVAFTIQLQQAHLLPALPAWVMSRQVAAGTNLGKGMPTGHWPAPGSQVKSRTDLLEALGFLPGGLCVHICVNWPKRHPGQKFPCLTPRNL